MHSCCHTASYMHALIPSSCQASCADNRVASSYYMHQHVHTAYIHTHVDDDSIHRCMRTHIHIHTHVTCVCLLTDYTVLATSVSVSATVRSVHLSRHTCLSILMMQTCMYICESSRGMRMRMRSMACMVAVVAVHVRGAASHVVSFVHLTLTLFLPRLRLLTLPHHLLLELHIPPHHLLSSLDIHVMYTYIRMHIHMHTYTC